jgi:hypothetical protein
MPVLLKVKPFDLIDVIIDIIVIMLLKRQVQVQAVIKLRQCPSKSIECVECVHRVFLLNCASHSNDNNRQLIGQRSSSVLNSEEAQIRSPAPSADGEPSSRHRHHQHQHAGPANVGQSSRRKHSHNHHHHHQQQQQQQSVGADGYGHINSDLIFIERGDHSPHRQEPPAGYEYKGKIEVQGAHQEHRSRSHGHDSFFPSQGTIPMPPPVPMPSSVAPVSGLGGCPPGWQQMILSAAPGGPCPPGGIMFTGQMTGMNHAGYGGAPAPGYSGGCPFVVVRVRPFVCVYFSAGIIGASNSGGGLADLAANLPLPAQGQLVADYIVEPGAGGDASSSADASHSVAHQHAASTSYKQHL